MATRDIDLYRGSYGLDEAVEDLRRLAERDLGDHFRFVYTGHRAILAGEAQPYTDGYRVEFDTYIGAQKKSSIGVDLSTGAGLTAEPTITAPASALDLPRLVGFEYRLYPVVDQIADKVCATMQRYDDRPSSREKDLVDIVVLAVTQDIDGTALTTAITTESSRREMDPIEHFVVPAQWGPAYKKQAQRVPYCADVVDVDNAQELASALIDPALEGTAAGLTWRATTRAWVSL
ncbi:MAG: nucleotidyl transferase AbiEii/AbiGii toxin family protein [Microthrixaceae bacterium]